jgi:heterodisulfide reductase subunit C
MDEPPNRVIRFLQLGLYDRVLEQNSYWVCSSFKEIMELLRHDAYRRGVTSGERVVVVFHKAFLKTVKWFGRLYEPGLIMLNNLLSGHFFKDFAAVPGMLRKGKIKLFPGRGADNAAVRRIFKYSREEAPRGEV